MNREELLRSPEYWITQVQMGLFDLIEDYRLENNMTKTQLAEKLGVTKGYVTQVLNGDFDHKISKLVNTALAFNKVPFVSFVDIDSVIQNDKKGISAFNQMNAVLYCHAYSADSGFTIKKDTTNSAYKIVSSDIQMQSFTTFNAQHN